MHLSALTLRPARALAALALCFAAPALAPLEAAAQSASAATPTPTAIEALRTRHHYKFYVGGVLVGKGWVESSFEDGAYHTASEMETDGVAGWFVEAKFNASVRGLMSEEAGLTPRTIKVKGVSDEKSWQMLMTYEGDAPNLVEVEPPFRKRSYDIDPKDQSGSLDPITALAAAVLPGPIGAEASPCGRTIPIFDGRRRYDVIMDEEISSDGTNVECASRFKRVGGFKQKHLDRPDYPFTTRFRLEDGFAIPTKIWGETDFGGAVVLLRK